jgi:hypothetical protein
VVCEERGWMQNRANPYARERAIVIARQIYPFGVSPNEVVTAVADVLDSIGDMCPGVPAGRLTQTPCSANLAYLRAIGGRDLAT